MARDEKTAATRRELLTEYVNDAEGLELTAQASAIPCERCGTTDEHDDDRISTMKGARPVPLNEIDVKAARRGERFVRVCHACWPTWGMFGYAWPDMKLPSPRRCPRCTGWIPSDENPGEYPGAMSRVRVGRGAPETEFTKAYATRSVEICSPCGEDEAMGHGLVPIEEWPVEWKPISYAPQIRDAVKEGRLTLIDEATGEPAPIDPDLPINIQIDDEELTPDSEVKLTLGIEHDDQRVLRMRKDDPTHKFEEPT